NRQSSSSSRLSRLPHRPYRECEGATVSKRHGLFRFGPDLLDRDLPSVSQSTTAPPKSVEWTWPGDRGAAAASGFVCVFRHIDVEANAVSNAVRLGQLPIF